MATTDGRRADLEQRGINVIRGLAMDAVQKANSGPPGHADGARAARARALHPDHEVRRRRARLARPRPLRAVDRARVDAPVLVLYLTGFGLELDDLERVPPVGLATAGHPEYRHTAGHRGHHRPARPGLRQRRRHRPRRGEPAGPLRRARSSTTTCSRSAATATSRRASATRRRRSPATSASAASSTSTTTTTSPSTARPSSRTPTTSRSASRATAGTSCELGEVANDLDALEAGLRAGMAEAERPSLLVLRSHIGYPSPKYTDTAKAHGSPLGADEVAAVKEILGLPAGGLLRARRRARVLPRGRRARPRRRARRGSSAAPRSATASRRWPTSSTRASSSAGSPGWEAKLPVVDGGRAASPPARRARRSLDAIARRRARARRPAAPTSPEHRHGARRRAGRSPRTTSAAASSTSASASTAWARS